ATLSYLIVSLAMSTSHVSPSPLYPHLSLLFFSLTSPPPTSTLCPYTTLFRSHEGDRLPGSSAGVAQLVGQCTCALDHVRVGDAHRVVFDRHRIRRPLSHLEHELIDGRRVRIGQSRVVERLHEPLPKLARHQGKLRSNAIAVIRD